MDVRGKLVELLRNSPHLDTVKGYKGNDCTFEQGADWLIAHGVTVQEWIPVKDRLPDAGGYVVCIAKRNPFSRFMPMVARTEKNGWANTITEQYISEVTHWIPLPDPPKGE